MSEASTDLADLRQAVERLDDKAERIVKMLVELGILHEEEVERIFGAEDQGPEVVA